MQDSFFADIDALEANFAPEKIVEREGKIREIARCLKPVLSGDFTVNLYVYGQPGVGKTLICKSILEEHFPKKFVYIDCFEDSTKRDVMEQVVEQAGVFMRGKPSTRVMMKRFKFSKKKFIVCLDRCELLKDPEIIEVFIENGCGIILISNKPLGLSRLAIRGNSKLYLDEIEFKPYTKDEMFQILKQRVEYALVPNTINERLLSIVAGMSEGDARRALQIVKLAVRNAETHEQEKITIENIREGAKQTRSQVQSKNVEKLSENEKMIFDVLKDSGRMSSGNLFKIYKNLSRNEMTDRTYRNQMTHLKNLGLVRESGTTKGRVYEIA